MGDGFVARQQDSAYTVLRGSREIALSSGDCLILAAKISGTFHYRHDKQLTLAQPGELLLFDPTRPWHLKIPQGSHETLFLPIARNKLLPRLAKPGLAAISPLKGEPSLNSLIKSYLQSLLDLPLPPSPAMGQALIDNFCGLLAIALGATDETRQTTGKTALQAARLCAIREYAEQRLGAPHLTPVSVALHFSISPRYLHKLFEETGSSFSQWLQACRLEKCRSELADPANNRLSIAEVAYRWGFSDQAHFSRCFRRLYGATPKEVRCGNVPSVGKTLP